MNSGNRDFKKNKVKNKYNKQKVKMKSYEQQI